MNTSMRMLQQLTLNSNRLLFNQPLTARTLSTLLVKNNNNQLFNNSNNNVVVRGFATDPAPAAQVKAPSTSDTKPTSIEYGTDNRPISPHVTIYNFPLPAIMSITHRFTGLGLSVGTYGFATLALFGSCDIPSYVYSFQYNYPILIPIAKLLVAFPFTYHYAAGMRHLYWDYTAKGVDLDSVQKTAQLITGGTALVTLIAMFYTI